MTTPPVAGQQTKSADQDASTIETTEPTIISGGSLLLIGPAGTGKTTSISTFIEAGIETFVLITDPTGLDSLIDSMEKKKLPMDLLHWNYVPPASPSWETLMDMADTIKNLSYSALTDIKSGLNKQDYLQFYQLLSTCASFTCQRTGEEFGPIDKWGPDRAFIIDSLSGVNTMAMDMTIGSKPIAHQGEWGVAMAAEERIIKKWCSDLKCFFVLIAHIQREKDEIQGGTKIMVDALGTKLAPKVPKDFGDVVLAVRDGTKYCWSTTALQVDLKAATLPLSDKLDPTFKHIVDAWKRRSKVVTKEEVKEEK